MKNKRLHIKYEVFHVDEAGNTIGISEIVHFRMENGEWIVTGPGNGSVGRSWNLNRACLNWLAQRLGLSDEDENSPS